MLKVAIVGTGYWGPNLVRNFAGLGDAKVVALCDIDASLAHKVAQRHCPDARIETDIEAIAKDSEIDAAVLATPVVTHHALGKKLMEGGKHLLVEKPLACTVKECEELVELAERRGLVLMVGHTFEYNTVVREIANRIAANELGRIFYIHGRRVNLGRIQTDVSALWSFGPHDVSILSTWLKTDPVAVSAHGYSCLTPGVHDVVFLSLDYPENIGVNLTLSWLNPEKVRQMTIVGSDKMIVFDDVSMEAKLQIHDKRVDGIPPQPGEGFADFGEFQLSVRRGDVHIPNVKFSEPLALECRDFVDSIREARKPLADGLSGLRVTRVLAAAQESLNSGNGRWVRLA
jgi:predicted dehydrogenase